MSASGTTSTWTGAERRALVIEYRRDRWRHFRSGMREVLAEVFGVKPGRHRSPRRRPLSVLKPVVVLTLSFLVLVSYGGGVSYGHWIAQAASEARTATGFVSVTTSGTDPVFHFGCETHRFPKHAISFVRFWAPSQEPGDLVPGGTGAVKIGKDGIEVGEGYSVDPADASIGDALTVYLGGTEVAIGSWVPKPQKPGEFVGFAFTVVGGPVVVDVKADGDLWRTTLSGSGLWSLDGVPDVDSLLITSCGASSIRGTTLIANNGSIPGRASIVLAGSADHCDLFDVAIETDADVAAQGSLCALLDQPVVVAEQLDPATSIPVSLTLTLLDSSDAFTLPLTLYVLLAQWNGDGWTAGDSLPFDVTVDISASEPDVMIIESASDVVEAGEVGEEFEEEADPKDGDEPAVDEEAPPADDEEPAEEAPPDETEAPPDEEPSPDEEAPPGEGEPPESQTVTLAGIVWNDIDGNGVTVDDEPRVAGTQVLLFDAAVGTVASTSTDEAGTYRIEDIAPGEYLVQFVAPEGFTFNPAAAGSDIEALAEELGVPVDTLIQTDVTSADGLHGRTEPLVLVPGTNQGLADASLTPQPGDVAPADPPTDEQPPTDEPPGDEQPPDDGTVTQPDDPPGDSEEPLPEDPPEEQPPRDEQPPDPPTEELATLSGYVWHDIDLDNLTVLDGSEPRIEAVEVALLDLEGVEVDSTVTDDTGFYEFVDIEPGTYVVAFTPPDGFEASVVEETDTFETPEDLEIYLAALAEEMGVPVEELILSDVVAIDDDTGVTGLLALEPGDNTGVADAALVPKPPDEAPDDESTVANPDGAAKEEPPPPTTPPDGIGPDTGSGDDTSTTTTTSLNNQGGDSSNENSDD